MKGADDQNEPFSSPRSPIMYAHRFEWGTFAIEPYPNLLNICLLFLSFVILYIITGLKITSKTQGCVIFADRSSEQRAAYTMAALLLCRTAAAPVLRLALLWLAVAGIKTTTGAPYIYPHPPFATIYGGELIKFIGFSGLSTNQKVTCDFPMPNGMKHQPYRKVTGAVIDSSTVGCVAPPLLFDAAQGYVDVELSVALRPYTSKLIVTGDASGRLNILSLEVSEGELTFTYEPSTLWPSIKQKHASLYRLKVDLEKGSIYASLIETKPIGQFLQLSMDQQQNKSKSVSRGASDEVTLFSLVPVDAADSFLEWESAVSKAGLVAQAVSILKETADRLDQVDPVMPEGIEEECEKALDPERYHCYTEEIDLPPCPPDLEKAKRDKSFQVYRREFKHAITRAAVCYVSVGAEQLVQQCCYNAAGKIMCGVPDGGTALLFSPFAYVAKHLSSDVWPRETCCKQTNFNTRICKKFFECRPKPNCGEGWKPPDDGVVGGEPNFVTLDKVSYSFMGYGEYWLYRSNQANIQIRQTAFPIPNYQSTWLKAVVVQCDNTTFQVEVDERPNYLNSFTVHAYKNRHPFSLLTNKRNVVLSPSMTADFGPSNVQGYNHYNLSILCETIAVKVDIFHGPGYTPDRKWMNVKVSAPCNFGLNISGLLGNCNGDKSDDFQPPGVPALPPTASTAEIFSKFGEKWRITKEESLFVYTTTRSFKAFNEPPADFKPMLEDPDPKTFPQEVQDACQSSIECYINYNASGGSLELGLAAKESKEQLLADAAVLNSPSPKYCNLLPFIENAIYSPGRLLFEVGERVNIACEANYTLVGLHSMVCPLDQKWPETPVAACYPSHLFNQHNTSDAIPLAPTGIYAFAADQGNSTDSDVPNGNQTVIAPPSFISGVLHDLYQTIGRFHPDYSSPGNVDQPTTTAAPAEDG